MTRLARSSPRSALVVEDHELLQVLLVETLRDRFGLAAIGVPSCREAARLLQGEPHEVILLDVRLQDGSGLDLLREQRPAVHAARAVVVMSSLPVYRDVARAAGVDAFLLKPFEVTALVQTLERLGVPSDESSPSARSEA